MLLTADDTPFAEALLRSTGGRAQISAVHSPQQRRCEGRTGVTYFTAAADMFGAPEYDSALETVRKHAKQTGGSRTSVAGTSDARQIVIDAARFCRRGGSITTLNVATVVVLPRDGDIIDELIWNELNTFARLGGITFRAIVNGELANIIGRHRVNGCFARLELFDGVRRKPRSRRVDKTIDMRTPV